MNLNFKLESDLKEYDIKKEVKQIKSALKSIQKKSSDIFILDLLKDIYNYTLSQFCKVKTKRR